MGDSFIALVPERYGISPAEQDEMEKRMVRWMQQEGLVEKEKSDCILSCDEDGYRFTPQASMRIAGEEFRQMSTYGFRVQKSGRQKFVFTNYEGGLEAAWCPVCEKNIVNHFYEMVEGWYNAAGYPSVKCPLCATASDIRSYRLDPQWGFSEIGFEFWNLGELLDVFVDEFAEKLGEPIRYIWAHL